MAVAVATLAALATPTDPTCRRANGAARGRVVVVAARAGGVGLREEGCIKYKTRERSDANWVLQRALLSVSPLCFASPRQGGEVGRPGRVCVCA